MKKKKINPLPQEGLMRGEALAKLQREGFDLTFEQLRKYELPGLITLYKKLGTKYRLFLEETLDRLRWILFLRSIGFSLPRIKKFLELDEKICANEMLITREIVLDLETGEKGVVREMPPPDVVNKVQFERLRVQLDEYKAVSNEIQEKADRRAKMLMQWRENTAKRLAEIVKMTEVRND